eukprot:TRINITY_DN4076_c0_g1_i1.p1 TRINITY_DN4076_c0_g1~~TRINITY_DN4076_c0_g1_i1.p1  ORF type:complete len:385 (-),score=95.50 TRINITY_DN4076_c0_g1_i1:757-1911(-)
MSQAGTDFVMEQRPVSSQGQPPATATPQMPSTRRNMLSVSTATMERLDERSPSPHRPHEISRQQARVFAAIKPDSPRFVEACKELGIQLEALRLRTPDEISGPNVPHEIRQLRWNHHVNRLYQTVQDILAKKREIRMRGLVGNEDPNATAQVVSTHSPKEDRLTSGLRTILGRTRQSLPIPRAHAEMFARTIGFFRGKEKLPSLATSEVNVSKSEELSLVDNSSLQVALTEEVTKFKKMKHRIQMEAKQILEEEKLRRSMAEELMEEEQRAQKLAFDRIAKRRNEAEILRKKREERVHALKMRAQEQAEKQAELSMKLQERQQKHGALFEREREMKRHALAIAEKRRYEKEYLINERKAALHREEERRLNEQFSTIEEKAQVRT